MAMHVCAGALMTCTFGAAPSSLVVLPIAMEMSGGPLGATIMDNLPIANIPPFGVCNSPSNPTVAAATAAAMGVLTPMPCVPVVPAPWVPGSPTVLVGNKPALNDTSKAICTWGGMIQFTMAGEFTVQIP